MNCAMSLERVLLCTRALSFLEKQVDGRQCC